MNMNDIKIDHTKCISIKNRKTFIQCTRKRINGTEFCGLHLRAKRIIRFDKIKNICNTSNTKTDIIIRSSEIPYELTTLESLRKSCKYYFKNIEIKKLKKLEMYKKLMNFLKTLETYLPELNKIIKIQSLIRRWLIYRRHQCLNKFDIVSMSSIFEIPSIYYLQVNDNGKIFSFDIRFLYKNFKINKKNPYTCLPFTDKALKKITDRFSLLIGKNIDMIFEKALVSPEKQFEFSVIELFTDMDNLDNYTDHKWFMDLNVFQLRKLYSTAEDIWNYRAQLSTAQKFKIVSNGQVFTIPKQEVNDTYIKRDIQNILIKDFGRMVREGIDVSEKKLGVMLILTALVEVSAEAADAYPYLVQSGSISD